MAQEKERETKLIRDAFLGYAKADFICLDPKFGVWNPCSYQAKDIKNMVLSMSGKMERYKREYLVPLIVPAASVNMETLSQEEPTGGDIYKVIEFTQDVTHFVGGGQHQFHAMEELEEIDAAKVRSIQAELDKASDLLGKEKSKVSHEDIAEIQG